MDASDAFQQALKLALKADNLGQDILQALADGDSDKAETLSLERQHTIEAIPFSEFTDNIPPALVDALQRIQQANDRLTEVTENIQREISLQLAEVKKGVAGSRMYRDVDQHN